METIEIINLAALLLVAGPVASVLTQLAKRPAWSAERRFALAILLSGLVGLAQAWLAGDLLGLIDSWGQLTATELVAAGGLVFAGASAFYKLYFSRSDWGTRLGAL